LRGEAIVMAKLKTTIKQANWKSKGIFGKKKEYHSIVTTIYYQSDDALIPNNSITFPTPLNS